MFSMARVDKLPCVKWANALQLLSSHRACWADPLPIFTGMQL
jgi:hypothetical protein